jgi:hypothetical protein
MFFIPETVKDFGHAIKTREGEQVMRIQPIQILLLFLAMIITSSVAAAQTTANGQANDPSNDGVATQLRMLRQSVQSLSATLGDIADKLLPLYAKAKDNAAENRNRIGSSLALLIQAEQRAEILRKQLLELLEKETSYRSRLAQIDEDMRPDNIERSLNLYGTTRTAELRDSRRRALENDRRGYESLLNLASQSRMRLEEDVRQADSLVTKLRTRLMPLIEREINEINPDKP